MALFTAARAAEPLPKTEFRGAWLHTVFQPQYARMGTEEAKSYLSRLLDSLQDAGINAILWQVRPQADAFYPSKLEPWSRFLTKDGKAPSPAWDPLQYMIDESHRRGMELHAWLNPYRVKTATSQKLPPNHIYWKHPERFVNYGKQMFFDPGLPENRQFIVDVITDIVSRYDVDGIHFDDYFYPYPVAGEEFPDAASYAKYGQGMSRGDWRRHNVDLLIEEVNAAMAKAKPWVRFGISPFGIWRNKKNDPRGSDTNGLQNYDALYADVLLWSQKGWVDYLMPQLYWDYSTKVAPYDVLVKWWGENSNNRHMYIGQDIGITTKFNALDRKVDEFRRRDDIQGVCWFPGYSITSNVKGVATQMARGVQRNVALVPSYPWISDVRPQPVRGLKLKDGQLSWSAPHKAGTSDDVTHWAVYRFPPGQKIDLTDPNAVAGITYHPSWTASEPGEYVVTALSRVNNESESSAPAVVE